MPDGTAELWVGSHNWTKRALLGLNVEASLVVRLTQTSPLVAAAADYLARMQAIAEPFDLAKVDVYKQLQRRMTTGLTPVTDLEAEDGASASQSIITVLATDRKDLTKLGTVRCEIHVALLDPKSDAQCVYPATILPSGLLPASDAAAGGISSAPPRFAYRHGQQLPTLYASGKVDAAVLNAAEYFVTVHLGELLLGVRAEAPVPREARSAGVGEGVIPLLARVGAEARERLSWRRLLGARWAVVGLDRTRPQSAIAMQTKPDRRCCRCARWRRRLDRIAENAVVGQLVAPLDYLKTARCAFSSNHLRAPSDVNGIATSVLIKCGLNASRSSVLTFPLA